MSFVGIPGRILFVHVESVWCCDRFSPIELQITGLCSTLLLVNLHERNKVVSKLGFDARLHIQTVGLPGRDLDWRVRALELIEHRGFPVLFFRKTVPRVRLKRGKMRCLPMMLQSRCALVLLVQMNHSIVVDVPPDHKLQRPRFRGQGRLLVLSAVR